MKTWFKRFLYFMKSDNNVLIVPDEYKKSKNYIFKGYHLFLASLCCFIVVIFIGFIFANYVHLYGLYREGKEAQINHEREYEKYAEGLDKIASDEKESHSKLMQFLKISEGKPQKKLSFGIGGEEISLAPINKETTEERFYSSLDEAQKARYDHSSYRDSLSNKLKGIHHVLSSLPVSSPIESSNNVEIKKDGRKILFQLKDGIDFESVLANAKGSVRDITVGEDGLYTVQLEYNFHIIGIYKGLSKILVHKGDHLDRFDKIGYIDDELSYELEEFGDPMDTGRFLYDLYTGNLKK